MVSLLRPLAVPLDAKTLYGCGSGGGDRPSEMSGDTGAGNGSDMSTAVVDTGTGDGGEGIFDDRPPNVDLPAGSGGRR